MVPLSLERVNLSVSPEKSPVVPKTPCPSPTNRVRPHRNLDCDLLARKIQETAKLEEMADREDTSLPLTAQHTTRTIPTNLRRSEG